MQLLKVGAAVLNQTPLAWDSNKAHILAAIAAARQQHVGLLCLPELCISGYGCEDAFLSPAVQRMAVTLLGEILPATQGHRRLARPAAVAQQRPLQHGLPGGRRPDLGLHRQAISGRRRHPLRAAMVQALARRAAGRRHDSAIEDYPLGDIYFDVGGIKIGFEICEDAWVANRPGGELARRGVDVILNPSASHFAFAKAEVRRRFVLEGSRAFGVSYVYANLLGNEAGRAIYDGGALIASAGTLLAAGPRFSFAEVGLTTAIVDIDATRMARARSGSFAPEFSDADDNCVRAAFDFPQQEFEPAVDRHAAWESGPNVKEEEFTRAIALGLFDYLRKSRSRGFVVSISGGADSAGVSCLIAAAVQLGIGELGLEEFTKRLDYILKRDEGDRHICSQASQNEPVPAPTDARQWVRRLLTCVYQSTRNSGNVTRSAARGVAEALGGEFIEFDVDALVQQYIALGSQAEGRPLNWETDDLALQNIQARVRSPGVWLLANLRGALLVATSNRSEAAVGYATMDGDTSGGISPIAGIDKAFLRRWLVWYERQGPEGIGPLAALAAVNRQEPTAELRPSDCRPNRRSRSDALRTARRHRAGRDSRQAQPAGSVQDHAGRFSEIHEPSNCWRGSSDSSGSGAATNGSASATPRRSTSTTRISTQKPGAAFRSCPAASNANWPNCGRMWRKK